LHRLHDSTDAPAALVLQDVDEADDGTLSLLAQLLGTEGCLPVPLVVTLQRDDDRGPVRQLLSTLRRVAGADALIEADALALESSPLDAQQVDDALAALSQLPVEIRRVLRAAAVVGASFEADIVAALLGVDPLDVMEVLQLACDEGIPIRDRGAGVFRMPSDVQQKLSAGILPSLAEAWNRHLALLLGGAPYDELVEPESDRPMVSEQAPESEREPRRAAAPAGPRDPAQQEQRARAADHAEAAGDADLAAGQHLAAARQAVMLGAYRESHDHAERALALVEAQPFTPGRKRMRIAALAERARVHWLAAGDGTERFSLTSSLDDLESCRKLLDEGDPVELHARIASLVADVSYDMGDRESLERALDELGEARQALLAAGRNMQAARLLNDEAAVLVQLGEPEKAGELLRQSREVFEQFADTEPVARLELAETEHLLARLTVQLLQAADLDEEMIRYGIDNAARAEQRYAELGLPREQARVWESLGRLERGAKRPERALRHLLAAVDVQQRIGDALGLARTTAALSELLADEGDFDRALDLLEQSIGFNRAKGSPRGLGYNRRSLELLGDAMGAEQRSTHGGRLAQLWKLLEVSPG
jgi:tetratricopeptide (TPR) repeat protein